GLALGLQTFEQILHAHARAAQELAPALDNRLVESQAIGDGQGIAASRQADAELVGRRKRLHIELNRSVDHAWLFVREGFKLRVVRRRDRRDVALQQEGQDRASQGRAFAGIGTRAQLIEQHQRAQAAPLSAGQRLRQASLNIRDGALVAFLDQAQNLDNAAQMRGKRAQTLLDALLVADISEDLLEDRDFRVLVDRDMQTGLSHQGQQANR